MATNKTDNNYEIDTFLKYFPTNNYMSTDIKQYVYTTEDIVPVLQDECIIIMKNIISLLAKGTNPNDINFRNTIKMNINKLNLTNYDNILEKLSTMTFSSEINISMLIIELIQGSIIVPVAYKGFSMQEFSSEDHPKSVPELCSDIFRHFCSYIFKVNDKLSLNFQTISLKILKGYFDGYMQRDRKMDENNNYNSDNYKGFMTFFGLLYSRNVISENIILYCMHTILLEIFAPDTKKSNTTVRNNTECTNLFGGYKHLLDFVILKNKSDIEKHVMMIEEYEYVISDFLKDNKTTENKILKMKDSDLYDIYITHVNKRKSLKTELQNQFEFVQKLIEFHQLIINNNNKIKSFDGKNTLVVPLRSMSMISTKSLGEQLNQLVDKFPDDMKINAIKYVHK